MDNKEAEGNSGLVEIAVRIVSASRAERSVSSVRKHGALVEGPPTELRASVALPNAGRWTVNVAVGSRRVPVRAKDRPQVLGAELWTRLAL